MATATATRTDIHRPSAPDFDPEAYDFVGCFDLHPEEGTRQARMFTVNALVKQGITFSGAPHPSGQCDHCGARIRYEGMMVHTATKTIITIGEICLDGRFAESAAGFKTLRAEAARKAKITREENARHETLTRVRAWLAAHDTDPLLVELSYVGNGGAADCNYFLTDIARKLYQYGDLSERQQAAAAAAITRDVERRTRDERRAQETAERQASGVQAPTGRVEVIGTVLATWTQDGDYGITLKFKVKTDEGYLVNSTVPASLYDSVGQLAELRGMRVAFTATLTPARDDVSTAWAKRPSKARLVA